MSNKIIKMPTPAPTESSSVKIKKLNDIDVRLPATKVLAATPRPFPSTTKLEEIGQLNTSKPAQYHIWEINHTFNSLFAISGDAKKDAMFLKFLPKFKRSPRPNDKVHHMRQLAFYNKGNKIFNLAFVEAELLDDPEVVKATRVIKRAGKITEDNQTWTVLIPVGFKPEDDRISRLIERFCYTLVRLDMIDVSAVIEFLNPSGSFFLRNHLSGKEARDEN